MDYEVKDNFLKEDIANEIERQLLDSDFPWFYSPYVSRATEEDIQDLEQIYFVHLFYNNFTINSQFYKLIESIVSQLDPKALMRIKGNLYPRSKEIVENGFHLDYHFESHTAVYYVNNNNGYTLLEDGNKIESVKNRILIMNKNILHSSTTCTDNKTRLTIAFNYFG